MIKIKELFDKIKNLKVLIIGDIILDTYWIGPVHRISPEAPIPIVSLKQKDLRAGGAANVALNCKSLNNHTQLLSVIGNDQAGKEIIKILKSENIDTSLIIQSEERITSNKIRILGNHQQITRIDEEQTDNISTKLENLIIQKINKLFVSNKPDVLIFQDYNKGVLTPKLIKTCILMCQKHNVISVVDPKKNNFFTYKNVTLFKPNLKELKEGLNETIDKIHVDSISNLHKKLKAKLNHQISLITLSELGIFYQKNTSKAIISAHIRNISDVSGAGDSVISVAALVYTATQDIHLTAELANLAGGLVCEEIGTVPIKAKKFIEEIQTYLK